MTTRRLPLTLLLMILIVLAGSSMLVPAAKAGTKLYGTQDGDINSYGGVDASGTAFYAGDNSGNDYYHSFVKFSLSGISGVSSAKLNIYLYNSYKDNNVYENNPLTNAGLGACRVYHIADYGTLDATDFNAASIGNDPGVLISSTGTPNIGYVPIDVTAAIQDDINHNRAFSAFMIKMETDTDNDDYQDGYNFYSSRMLRISAGPYIEHDGLSNPVAGVLVPVDKFYILTPYLALAGLIVAVSAVVAVKKRRD